MRRPALQVGRVGPLVTSSRSAESPAMISYPQCVVGVDLGDRVSLACVYAQGVIVEWMEFAMTPEGVRKAFEGKGYARVAMEAGAQSGWVTRLLRTLGYEPVVADPRKLKAISANTRKSDRNDAFLLAKLVWSDPSLLHPIHHRSEARALGLSLLSARDTLVRARSRLVSAVRSMCKGVGMRLKSRSADAFVHHEPDVPAELAPITAGMFTALRTLNEQVAAYDAQLETMLETSFREALRVKQVRGVGPITALVFVLTLEDPSQFPDGRTAAAFLGLVPRRDQSGAIDKQLGISKTGTTLLRRLLVQCAHHILGPLGHDCDIQRWGRKLMERGGKSARKRAIVAAARKLAVLLFRLWKRDEEWKPLYNAESPSDTGSPGADADRPQPAVTADCANVPDDTGDRERRRRDCSADDGSDPSMHRTQRGSPESANRSMGIGTPPASTPVAPGKPKRSAKPAKTAASGTSAKSDEPAKAANPVKSTKVAQPPKATPAPSEPAAVNGVGRRDHSAPATTRPTRPPHPGDSDPI